MNNTQQKIKDLVTSNPIVLFMKGIPEAPQCGFSAQTVQFLKAVGAKFTAVDVLADPEIRQGIKDYANWPTIPQLYINGEFIGGCDIITEMYQRGELKTAVDQINK